jgi:hypothetical protein
MPITPRRTLKTFKYAVYFDGVDDYVALFTTNYPSFTIVAWIRLATLAWLSPGWRAIVSKGWHTRAEGVGGLYVNLYGGCGGHLRDTAGRVYSATYVLPQSFLSSFYCMALTSEMKLYVNGRLVALQTIPNPLNTNTRPWNIGRDPIEPARVLPGYVAIVLIYSRTLEDFEIQWNYLYPDNPIKNGLVLRLKADPNYVKDIDGDGVLEWIDLSGNNNHGKVYGATLVELVKAPARALAPIKTTPVAR